MNDEQMKEQPNITDPDFRWTNSASTDVQATWRKHGWTPPSESKREPEKAGA